MKLAAILSVFISFGASASAQFIDMGSLLPTLTFPDPKPIEKPVTQDKRVIKN